MAGEAAVSVLFHLKPSSVEIGEGHLRGDAGVQVLQGVQLLYGSRGHAVAVAEDARGRPDIWGIAGAGGHRRAGTADVAAGAAAVLPHQVPSPFRACVLKPHLNSARSETRRLILTARGHDSSVSIIAKILFLLFFVIKVIFFF